MSILGGIGKALGGVVKGGLGGGLVGGLAKAGISALGSLGKGKKEATSAPGGGSFGSGGQGPAMSASPGGPIAGKLLAKKRAASSRSFSGSR